MMSEREDILSYLTLSIDRFTKHSSRLKETSKRISFYRLFLFLTAVFCAAFFFFRSLDLYAWGIIILFIFIFGILSTLQNKIETAHKKSELWIKLKRLHIARMLHDWENLPYLESTDSEMIHPFETDLNITGKHSLMHLIDYSNSLQGNKELLSWLLSDIPDKKIIKERQAIVQELIKLEKFRNKMLLASRLISKKALDGDKILKNIKNENNFEKTSKILPFLVGLALLNIILIVLFYFLHTPPLFIISLSAYAALYFFNGRFVSDLFDKTTDLESDIGKFVPVLDFLENYHYGTNKALKEFCSCFLNDKPSNYFKKLHRVIYAVSFQKNPFLFMLLNALFPWDFYFANKFEEIKIQVSDKLEEWLQKWYKLEALISLANIKAYNPQYNFPTINEGKESLVNIKHAGHPLIPFEHNVTNSLTLNNTGETIIITGSNMSGKSTFLKTIGTNMILAYAGGPVYAKSFNIALLRLNTCIKISDSVTEGISYFYAEVKRLKRILDNIKVPNNLPVFYLIDEIFKGTNNIERITGSRSYIKTVAELNCCGLITTHDLELVRLNEQIPGIRNFHFREETEGNKMVFDYRLREGPCPTTNALKIMEIEGLPVSYPL